MRLALGLRGGWRVEGVGAGGGSIRSESGVTEYVFMSVGRVNVIASWMYNFFCIGIIMVL